MHLEHLEHVFSAFIYKGLTADEAAVYGWDRLGRTLPMAAAVTGAALDGRVGRMFLTPFLLFPFWMSPFPYRTASETRTVRD